MPKIVNTALKATGPEAKAKAIKFGLEAPRGQGLASRTTSLGPPDTTLRLIRWLHSYLSCRGLTVRVDNHYSDLLYLTAGMPQGSRLGPLTFLLLITFPLSALPTNM